MRKTIVIPLLLALAGCSTTPPTLSENARKGLDAPMPTSDAQRAWDCAGTTDTIGGLKFLYKMQGRPADSDGEIWALQERARRIGCTQAEMNTRDMGRFSDPNWPEKGKTRRPQ